MDTEVEAPVDPGMNGINGEAYGTNGATATPVDDSTNDSKTSTSKKRLSRLPVFPGSRVGGRKVSSSSPSDSLASPSDTLSPTSPAAEKSVSPKSPRLSMAYQRSPVQSSIKSPGSFTKTASTTAAKPAANGIPKPASMISAPKTRTTRPTLPTSKQGGAASGIPKSGGASSTKPSSSSSSAIGSPAGARKLPRPSLASPKVSKVDDGALGSSTLPKSAGVDAAKRRSSLALSSLPTLSTKKSAPQLNGSPSQVANTGRRASAYGASSFGLRPQRSFSSQVSSPASKSDIGVPETPKSATKFRAPASALTSPIDSPISATKLRAPASALKSPRLENENSLDSPTPKAPPSALRKPTSKPPSLRLKKPAPRPPFVLTGESALASEPSHNSGSTLAPPAADKSTDETNKKQRSASASQALRDQIAKAKAARRSDVNGNVKISNQTIELDFGNLGSSFDHGIGLAVGPNTGLLTGRIKAARSNGKLNISNMDLKEIPETVYKMYQMDNMDGGDKWYESVDLVRFIAADNELTELGDGEKFIEQFGGLEHIDFHNNLLTALPKAITDLSRLATLNLASNKITNDALDVVFSIPTLVDLNLSKNHLTGALSEDISKLMNLESLEIHTNKIESLPESLKYLTRLKVLNVSLNLIKSLPSLTDCPLVDLNVSSNLIKGALFSEEVTCMKHLQTLDLKNNSITSITTLEFIQLPSIKQIMASNNQLDHIKYVTGWNELLVFLGESNQLKEIPEGVLKLPKLRVLDVASNDISVIPAELGRMDSLETFKFNGNPIRERRLLNLNTEDLKLTLAAKLEPPVREIQEVAAEIEANLPNTAEESMREVVPVPEAELRIKPGGVLDLSSRKLETVDELTLGNLNSALVKILQLYKNSLTEFSPILSDFKGLVTLDISCNKLKGDNYLDTDLNFAGLTSLIMHNNSVTSLEPVTKHITAPKLAMLDIHGNKVKQIPPGLKKCFPALMTFMANENKIEEIDVDAVNGIKSLNLSNNEIAALPPRLGIVKGMTELRVDGNRFRVPKYQILEKGTESVLSWLRDRLPPEEQEEAEEDEAGGGVPIDASTVLSDEGDESWYDPPN